MNAKRIAPDDQPMREIRTLTERYREMFPPDCQARGCTDPAARDEIFCKRHRLTDAF